MDKHLKVLELDKILNLLAEQTSCEDAKKIALSIEPKYSLEEVNTLLNETYDAHMLIGRLGSPSFGGITNVVTPLKRAESGSTLSMGELLQIAGVLRVFRLLKDWKNKVDSIKSNLDNYFESIVPNKYFENKIFNSIISEDEISDEASAELKDIRRKIRLSSSKVRDQLDKLIKSSTYQKYLQDPIVTMRSGRFVIPVKSEYRSEISGLVHDTSSSGATVFVEPMSVVEINNNIKILQSREAEEIERILYDLSCEAGSFASSIIDGYKTCVNLNVIFAKANLAYKMNSILPVVNQNGHINLKKARHPLIDPKDVVATNINLGLSFNTLVITGPNTGGKTVSLKTIGLLTAMSMCGLMIPAGDNSEVSIFNKILVDIGDEQSIEQSLSTFSSHMTNIIKIIDKADSKSLILLDELGAGTDPIEGAALATSILETLKDKQSKIAATTHYAELKEYALNTSGVENACCEFDVSTLKPTYKLLIGVPGRSNAFAISQKLGMPIKIIDRAKLLVSSSNANFEDVISKLESSRQNLEKEKAEIENLKRELINSKNESNLHLEEIKKFSNDEMEKAKIKAQELVTKTRVQANILLDEIDALRKSKDTSIESKSKLKADLKSLENSADPINKKENTGYVLPRKLKIGDDVLIFDIDKKAVVIEPVDSSNNVLVQAGIIKTRVSIANLRLLNEKSKKTVVGSTTRTIKSRAETNVSTSLDLRGMSALEAIIELDNFIDSSILTGIQTFTVIHGKGTGVLRKEVQAHLKKHPNVKSYRLGVYGEGEAGVTIVELK